MKRLFTLIVVITAMLAANAQAPRDSVIRPFNRPLMLSVTYGKNINTGGNENEYWFGRQPTIVNEVAFRLSYMFGPRWGIYGDFYFNSFSDWNPPLDLEWWDEFNCGVRSSGGAGLGAMYRFEHRRWQLYARAGAGFGDRGEGPDLTHYIGIGDDDSCYDAKEVLEARRITEVSYINFGVTGGYRISRVFSIIMDINYHCPLSSSKVEFTHKTNPHNGSIPKILDRKVYHSRSWGNNLTISIGLQLQCELSKR
ncbi:MAG: porin family protein [Muribaculaceae bacterium]|nr:porin family protein [Muribaculaceae bacterium]